MTVSLCLIGIAQAFFSAVLILSTKTKGGVGQGYLATWLLVISVSLLFNWISFTGNEIYFPLLLMMSGLKAVHGPLLLFYSYAVLDRQFRLRFKDLLHFLPYLLIVTSLFYYRYFANSKLVVRNGYLIFQDGAPWLIEVYQWVILLSTLVYPLAGIYLLQRERANREIYFSDLDKIEQRWLRYLLWGAFIGYALVYIVSDLISVFILVSYEQVALLSTLTSVILAYYATYVNYKHMAESKHTAYPDGVSKQVEPGSIAVGRFHKAGLPPEKLAILYNRLLEHMDKKRPYLDSQLTLRELSDQLNTTTNHLSQVINEKFGDNFFVFVNTYRVEAFERLASNQAYNNYTVFGIALLCGFSSKSTFYTIFKKLRGVTPSEYLKTAKIR